MKFYGLKTCDTCKKAQKALGAAGVSFDVIDVRADGVSVEDLQRWLDKVGDEVLVNRRSTTWRGMDEAARAEASGAGAAALLAANPTLIKRPVIVVGDDVHVGWTKDVQAALL